MRIYQCDFCKEQKVCSKTNIDGKVYDICQQCRDKRNEQLEGCGDVLLQPYWTYGNWYTTPYVITTTPTPTIFTYTTTSGQYDQNASVPQCQQLS